jgi:mono/diheme cytochrome c family protein
MRTNLWLLLLLVAILWISLPSCDSNPYKQGKIMYDYYCANCHMEDGSGLEGVIPPLVGVEDYLTANRDILPCIVKYGWSDTIQVKGVMYAQEMPGVPQLTDVEIANILNYILFNWNENQEILLIEEVQKNLENCPEQ